LPRLARALSTAVAEAKLCRTVGLEDTGAICCQNTGAICCQNTRLLEHELHRPCHTPGGESSKNIEKTDCVGAREGEGEGGRKRREGEGV
jgi:hypothetical protein